MPMVSVVIPVYNVEGYLALTLDSVRRQTLEDIEIVCVNDGSTDHSLDVLKLYATLDERVKVIDRKNGGVASARNAGLDAATGEFVCFLDSDDLLEPQACERMVAAFREHGADTVTYAAKTYPTFYTNGWLDEALTVKDKVYQGFEPDLMFVEPTLPFSWHTASRRDLLNEHAIRFPQGMRFGEDAVFQFCLMPRAQVSVLISDVLVNYRMGRQDSLMNSHAVATEERLSEHVGIMRKVFEQWDAAGFLQKWPAELLDWSLGFCAVGAAELDGKREQIYDGIQELYHDFFDDAFLEEMKKDQVNGPLVRAVLGERRLVDNPVVRLDTVCRYFAAKGGHPRWYSIVRHIGGNSMRKGILGKLKAALKKVLPMPASHANQYFDEADWFSQERFERMMALEGARLEAAGKNPMDWGA